MATNIIGVIMTQPLSDPGIAPNGNFTMGGQIQTAGGGGWAESGDMYFEWDQGTSTWATLGSTGALNVAAQTNPVLGLQDANEHTITVYNDGTTGSFQVRVKLIEDDLTEYTTTPVDVVIAGAQTYYQNTGQGSISPAGSLPKQTYKTMGEYSLTSTGALASAAVFGQGVGGGTISPSGVLGSITTFVCDVGEYALSIVGSLAKQTSKTIGGYAMSITGGLTKQTSKSMGGHAMSIAGTLATATIFLQAVGGYTMIIFGNLIKKTTIFIGTGIINPVGSLIKQTSIYTGKAAITITGSLITAVKFLQNVGNGSVGSTGILGIIANYSCNVGGAVISIAGVLGKVFTAGSGAVVRGLSRLGMHLKS